jgi:hypothetical protein
MSILKRALLLAVLTACTLSGMVWAWGGGGPPAGCKDESKIRYCNTITYSPGTSNYGPVTARASTTSNTSAYYYHMYVDVQLRHNGTLECNAPSDDKVGGTQGVFASCASQRTPTGWTSSSRHRWRLISTHPVTERFLSARY